MTDGKQFGTYDTTGSDGRAYTVDVFVELPETSEWSRWAYFAGNEPCTRLAKGEYQIDRTGVILKTTDTNAP